MASPCYQAMQLSWLASLPTWSTALMTCSRNHGDVCMRRHKGHSWWWSYEWPVLVAGALNGFGEHWTRVSPNFEQLMRGQPIFVAACLRKLPQFTLQHLSIPQGPKYPEGIQRGRGREQYTVNALYLHECKQCPPPPLIPSWVICYI